MQKVASLSESNAFFERLLAALESTTTDRGAPCLKICSPERGVSTWLAAASTCSCRNAFEFGASNSGGLPH